MKIGTILKQLRNSKSLTLEELAEKAELSVAYISCLERDKRNLNFKSLELISKALEVPLPVIVFMAASKEDLGGGTGTLSELQDQLKYYVQNETEISISA